MMIESYKFNLITQNFRASQQYAPNQIYLYNYYLNSRNIFSLTRRQPNIPIAYKLLEVSETLLQFHINIARITERHKEFTIIDYVARL